MVSNKKKLHQKDLKDVFVNRYGDSSIIKGINLIEFAKEINFEFENKLLKGKFVFLSIPNAIGLVSLNF